MLLGGTLPVLRLLPQQVGKFLSDFSMLAPARERYHVSASAAAHLVEVSKVQVMQGQELAFWTPIVGKEAPLRGAQVLIPDSQIFGQDANPMVQDAVGRFSGGFENRHQCIREASVT